MERGALGTRERTKVILFIAHAFNELSSAMNSVFQGALGSLFVLIILRADPLSVVRRGRVRGEKFSVPRRFDVCHTARLPPGLHVNSDLLLQVLQSRTETQCHIAVVLWCVTIVVLVTCLDVSGVGLLLLPGSSGPSVIPAMGKLLPDWSVWWVVLCSNIDIVLFCFKIFP